MKRRPIVPVRVCGNTVKCWRCGTEVVGKEIDLMFVCPRREKNAYTNEKQLYTKDVDRERNLKLFDIETT